MMRPRIWINLAFFAVLGTVLTAWVAGTLVHIDAVERPFHVTADFDRSPGLHKDLQVTYLGVGVGRVGTVRLRTGAVSVRLDIDRGARIPSNATAQVLRKSAIGEPYIELSPPRARPARQLRGGDHIAVSAATAVDYQRLFGNVSAALDAVDPGDAKTIVHELAGALDGRGESIHDIIGDTDQITGTLAAHSELLDDLSTQLTRLTHTLAENRDGIASGLNNTAAFMHALSASRRDFDTVLARGPGFLQQTYGLLQGSRSGLDCLLDAFATPGPPVFTAAAAEQNRRILTMIPMFRPLVKDVMARTPQATYLKVKPLITLNGPVAAEEYPAPTARPMPPKVPRCTSAAGGSGRGGGTTTETAGGTAPTPSAEHGAGRPAGPGASATNLRDRPVSAPTTSSASRLLPLLPIGAALAVLLIAAARAVKATAGAWPRRSR